MTTDAARVLELARSRTATLHEARLVCVDGPAGSGKTTLAAQIAALAPGTTTVHMDDLYEGWRGLARIDEQLGTLLRPLAEGRAGSYRRWDWLAGSWAETVNVAPAPLLVVEGVGSGARAVADLVTVLVWVEAPAPVRRTRGLERDGAAVAAHWDRFVRDETALFAREDTRDRADLVLDGGPVGRRGGEPTRVWQGRGVDPRISFVTLAAHDLAATRRFYVDGLGWTPELDVPGEVVMIKVGEHLVLSLWDEAEFEAEVGPIARGEGGPPFSLAHNVPTREEVDAVLDDARRAGADVDEPCERDWGGYTGYFTGPDQVRWEVAWNPGEIGQMVLPG